MSLLSFLPTWCLYVDAFCSCSYWPQLWLLCSLIHDDDEVFWSFGTSMTMQIKWICYNGPLLFWDSYDFLSFCVAFLLSWSMLSLCMLYFLSCPNALFMNICPFYRYAIFWMFSCPMLSYVCSLSALKSNALLYVCLYLKKFEVPYKNVLSFINSHVLVSWNFGQSNYDILYAFYVTQIFYAPAP